MASKPASHKPWRSLLASLVKVQQTFECWQQTEMLNQSRRGDYKANGSETHLLSVSLKSRGQIQQSHSNQHRKGQLPWRPRGTWRHRSNASCDRCAVIWLRSPGKSWRMILLVNLWSNKEQDSSLSSCILPGSYAAIKTHSVVTNHESLSRACHGHGRAFGLIPVCPSWLVWDDSHSHCPGGKRITKGKSPLVLHTSHPTTTPQHTQESAGSMQGELWGHSRMKTDLDFHFQLLPLPELDWSCSEEDSCPFFALLILIYIKQLIKAANSALKNEQLPDFKLAKSLSNDSQVLTISHFWALQRSPSLQFWNCLPPSDPRPRSSPDNIQSDFHLRPYGFSLFPHHWGSTNSKKSLASKANIIHLMQSFFVWVSRLNHLVSLPLTPATAALSMHN